MLTVLTVLHSNEAVKITVNAFCYDSRNVLSGKFFNNDSKKEKFTITLSSNRLDQSKDALQDNTGGYVNVPEEKYAFIANRDSYRLYGSVERSKNNNINQFFSNVYSSSKKFINTKELYNLSNSKNLKLIQKINLENRNNKVNSIDVYFDKNMLDAEYQKCEEQINKSIEKFYFQLTLLILFLLGLVYFLIRKYKK